ncbi:MAG TPA: CAP domain-containing protein [Polyangiaceae bacterium]|nr:CAP domain-containing protein [Polyangiaceae bacterium]
MRSWVLKYVAVGGCSAILAVVGACSGSASVPSWNPGGDDGGGSSGSGGGSTSSGGAGSSGSNSSSGAASSNGGSGGGGNSSGSSGAGGSNSGSGGGSTSSSGSGGGSNSGSGSGGSSGGSTSSSGGGSGSSSGGSTDPLTAARQQCVQTINDYRATVNSAPLAENTAEESCVDGQAQADAKANTPHSAFGNCQEFAQDECPGWPGPPASIMGYMSQSCLDQMWAEGPPPQGQDNHWLNMENPQYTKVACGFYQDSQGSWWATQDFW